MRTQAIAILGAIVSASCAAAEPSSSSANTTATPVAVAPPADETSVAGGEVAPPRRGNLPVTITNLAPGKFEIVATESVALATRAAIERRGPDGWTPLANLDLDQGYRLVESCGGAAPACVQLDAGKVMRPMPFLGFDCGAQCNGTCRANSWTGPGEMRLVVHGCNGDTAEGPSFEMPSSEHVGESFERWKATTDIVRGSAMRLSIPQRVWHVGDPAKKGLLAGFDIDSKEVPLAEAELATLLELLRSPTGYDDKIMKRCRFGPLVGFRLVRSPATTSTSTEHDIEIAIDFRCMKLFIVEGGTNGHPRTIHATHADPSRPGWLELARASLPSDAKLQHLK
jgi:hypothetical protein